MFNIFKLKLTLVLLVFTPLFVTANHGDFIPDEMHTYKTVDGIPLELHTFLPEGFDESDERPVVVFFFAGGWVQGVPAQFYSYCDYFASLGIVTMAAEYRVSKFHNGTTPYDSVKDAKSAMRWIRANASSIGIDPNKIIASGGSAGGHIAAATGILDESQYNNVGDDLNVSCRPDSLVLFNAVIDNSSAGYGNNSLNDDWEDFSPYHNANGNVPPILHLSGSNDTLILPAVVEDFSDQLNALGVNSQYHIFPNEGHGFFNFERNAHDEAMARTHVFLASLGYVPALSGSIDNFTYVKRDYPKTTYIEAEGLNASGWTTESNSAAEGGTHLTSSNTANVTIKAADYGLAHGEYVMDIAYFDTNNGSNTYSVTVDGVQVSSWISGEDFGVGNFANGAKDNYRTPIIEVERDSQIKITVTPTSGSELANIDAIVIHNAVVIEAELPDKRSSGDYSYFPGSDFASNLGYITVNTGLTVNCITYDTYVGNADIYMDYFDESDGASTITLDHEGSAIGTITLNGTSSSNQPSQSSLRTHIFKEISNLQDEDFISISSVVNGSELAAVDRLVIVPSDSFNFSHTAIDDATIIYTEDASYSSQNPTEISQVIVTNGARVTLDVDTTVSTLTAESNSRFYMYGSDPHTVVIEDEFTTESGALVYLSGGEIIANTSEFVSNAWLTVLGSGVLNLNGDPNFTINGTGRISVNNGELNVSDSLLLNSNIRVVNGALNIPERLYVTSNGKFEVIGSGGTVNTKTISKQSTTNAGEFEFVLDENGVSSIDNSNWAFLENYKLTVNAGDYAGGESVHTLFEVGSTTNFSGFTAENISLEGFAELGLDAEVVSYTGNNSSKVELRLTLAPPAERILTYATDGLYSAQTPTGYDSVKVTNGARVTLDVNTTVSSLTVGSGSRFNMFGSDPHTAVIGNELTTESGAVVYLAGGELVANTSAFTSNGWVAIAGEGVMTLNGAPKFTVNGAGTISVTNGELNVSDGLLLNSNIRVINGDLNIPTYLTISKKGSLRVMGSGGSVNTRFIHPRSATDAGEFEFVLDEEGISTIENSAWAYLHNYSLIINAGDYDGGAEVHTLFEVGSTTNFSGFSSDRIRFIGFAELGLNAEVVSYTGTTSSKIELRLTPSVL